jgi:hypothetical protein
MRRGRNHIRARERTGKAPLVAGEKKNKKMIPHTQNRVSARTGLQKSKVLE